MTNSVFNKLKVLDLFSGIGGFSVGLERTGGFETVAFCEKDEECQKVLRKNWPNENIPIFTDILKLQNSKSLTGKFNQLEDDNIIFGPTEIDLICGGFPCQSISENGKKEGFIDANGEKTRSGLWFEQKRIIQEVGPKWVIIENVSNLRSLGLAEVLKDLWEIGYASEWSILSARDFGSCHLRERVWIVAYPSDTKCLRQASSKHDSWGRRSSSRPEEEIFESHCSEFSEDVSPRIFGSRSPTFSNWWKVKSKFYRVDDGVPNGPHKVRGDDKRRKERIKQLGNAVVPHVVEYIGNLILDYDKGNKRV